MNPHEFETRAFEANDSFMFCSGSLMNDSVAVGNLGSMPTATPPSAAGMRKSWHEDITQDLRNHLVHKL